MPIVFNIGSDPVAMGLVATLSRPGKNVTGVAMLLQTAVTAKRLELLHELASIDTSIAILVNPGNPGFAQADAKEAQQAARTLFHGGIERAWSFSFGADAPCCGGKLG
jgi:putative ABC transport system substrate-binding protein